MRTRRESFPGGAVKQQGSWSGSLELFAICLMIFAAMSFSGCAGYTGAAGSTGSGGTGSSGGGVLTGPSTSISFGNVAVGSTATQNVTVTNTGTGTVSISGATITGGVFTVVGGNPSSSLPVGQSATVQVQFTPTSMTPASGALIVTSDASDSSLSIALSGTGLEAVAAFSPTSLNFSNLPVGQSSTQTVTLSNSGNMNLSVTAAAVSGTGFTMSGITMPATVAPNQSTTFSVRFAPTSTTGSTGSAQFTDNGQGSPQTFTMTGSAVATGSTLGANPGSFNFGNVVVGSNGTQAITLTNSGTTAITINRVVAAGTGFSASVLTANQTIAAGATATVTAKFAPTTAGAVSGSITINSTATNAALVVSLNGTGTQGALTANPSSINFGSILIGNTASANVTVTNSGTASLSITAASASGTGFSMSTLSPQTLTPGQTASFTATFGPTVAGNASGSVSITNSTGSPLIIGLSGSGATTQAQLAINPSPLNFNSVNVGSNAMQTVTLTNTGNATLNITAATITGSGYTMSLQPTSINAGANTAFTVTFTPTTGGSTSGSISITSNAPNSPASIGLSGTGLQAQISATPSSVPFGTVVIGNTNSQSVALKNNGNTTLTFSQINVSGTVFNQTGLSTTTTIAAGASATFNATFTPSSTTPVTGTITLTTNGTPSQLVINLSGTGQTATFLLGANPTSLSFGSVNDGTSSQLTSSLTNNGNSNLTISSVTATGTGFTVSGVANNTVLTPGQSATLTVTFAPAAAGAVTGASITIASNAAGSPATIGLSGTGAHWVALSWTASATSGVTYNVFRGTSSGAESTTPLNTTAISGTTYSDANVTSGQTYYYTVEAVNSAGSSAPSNEASAAIPTP
jgi:hypothetical protein